MPKEVSLKYRLYSLDSERTKIRTQVRNTARNIPVATLGQMVISTDHILFEYLLCRGTFREPIYVATECADSCRAPITCAKIKGASVPAVLKLLSGKGGVRIWRKSDIALFSYRKTEI